IPGPTSRTGISGYASTVSAIALAIFRSVRKCCPRFFLGLTALICYIIFCEGNAKVWNDKISLSIFTKSAHTGSYYHAKLFYAKRKFFTVYIIKNRIF